MQLRVALAFDGLLTAISTLYVGVLTDNNVWISHVEDVTAQLELAEQTLDELFPTDLDALEDLASQGN